MLSNTKGYSRYSRSSGLHRDDLSVLSQLCPTLRATGKCKTYQREQELRRTIAAAKEAELLKKATALYTAQMDLVADLGDDDAEDAAAMLASFSTDPAKRAEVIGKLVAELKLEPAYLNWSLDAAVAERMVQLRVKPCRYTHRGELTTSLKRSRGEQGKEEVQLMAEHQAEQQKVLRTTNAIEEEEEHEGEEEDAEEVGDAALTNQQTNGGEKSGGTSTASPASSSSLLSPPRPPQKMTFRERAWEAERHRIFLTLTPLQRCVVCLLWQRTYKVQHGVVCDVRLLLERRLTEVFERTGAVAVDGAVVAARPAPKQQTKSSSGKSAAVKHTAAAVVENEEEEEEDALDAYLSSAAFEELVERESKRLVTRVAFRPEFGMVDLSALPLLVAHLSTTPTCGVFLARTLTYFTGKAMAPRHNGAESEKAHDNIDTPDDRPAPRSFHHLLFPTRQAMTEKEIDLGGTARADEVVEAVEWSLRVLQREAQLHAGQSGGGGANATAWATTNNNSSSTTSSSSSHVSALFRNERVRLHGFTMTHCKITSADALVAALQKRCLADFLYALDLSDNRLWSLRFLLVLRAHYAHRLLRLSLKSNPITRKPEYQEQVRLSLPQLTSLDGEPIRRPPLRMPKPLPSSCTRWPATNATAQQQEQQEQEQAEVLDCVARLLYIWESRRIPHTQRELRADISESKPGPLPVLSSASPSPAAAAVAVREEEEWNEDNFPHRYLHPTAAFSVALAPGLSFFDSASMKDARAVEADMDYAGMRLSPIDLRDARVFDVAMKNSSRNLLAGRPALRRFGTGADNCYQAYQLTLYPERMAVEHHVTDAVVAVARVVDVAAPPPVVQQQASEERSKKKTKASKVVAPPPAAAAAASAVRFGSAGRHSTPTQHVVTLHGVMTWHLPSMKSGECMRACYTRVMIFVKKVLPAQNREWERLRSPPYVLLNDQLFLYPTPSPSSLLSAATVAPCAIFRANTPARLSRLVVEFGLEACRDGVALVRDVMERCTSPAAEYAALQALVLGLVGPRVATGKPDGQVDASAAATAGTLVGEDAATLRVAREAEAQLTPVLEAFVRRATTAAAAVSVSTRSYVVFSVLDGGATETDAALQAVGAATPSSSDQRQPAKKAKKEKKNDTKGGEVVAINGEDVAEPKSELQMWAAAVHTVTLELLHHVTAITNACYTSL